MWALVRKYLLAGFLVWVPILVTIFVLHFIVNIMDKSLALLPAKWQVPEVLGFHVPGVGLVLTLVILFFTGMLATNFLGKKFAILWDKLINKIPLVRTVYMGVKQVMDTLFKSNGTAFRKVLLVEYPRKGLWSIAFQTAHTSEQVSKHVHKDMLTIFIPTTPNPTSGFLMMIPREEAIELDLSVDQALKMVISLGVVQPVPDKVVEQLQTNKTSSS